MNHVVVAVCNNLYITANHLYFHNSFQHLSSDVCSFDNSLNYSILLVDSRRERLEERVVRSNTCNNNLCSTSFITSFSSNQSYLVFVYAVNAFGQSNAAESVPMGKLIKTVHDLSQTHYYFHHRKLTSIRSFKLCTNI